MRGALLGTVVVGIVLVAGCGDDDEAATTTTTTAAEAAAGDFCEVQPRFAEQLNMTLANVDPDTAQYTQIPMVLAELAPVIDELRAAEPGDLDGVVDTWVAEMERFAAGEEVADAEAARARMDDWVAQNC